MCFFDLKTKGKNLANASGIHNHRVATQTERELEEGLLVTITIHLVKMIRHRNVNFNLILISL